MQQICIILCCRSELAVLLLELYILIFTMYNKFVYIINGMYLSLEQKTENKILPVYRKYMWEPVPVNLIHNV